jgi:hypothetical protein
MKPVLLLPVLVLAACAGTTEPPTCRGEVFPLNPTRMAPPETLAAAPAVVTAESVVQ